MAQLSDAVQRRTDRASNLNGDDTLTEPDHSAGIELIANLYAGDRDEHVEEPANDVLDQALARQQSAPDTGPLGLPGQDDHQLVRAALEHHHERLDPRKLQTMTPRGSADLASDAGLISVPREPQSAGRTLTRTRLRRVAASLAAVVGLVGLVAVASAEISLSTPTHHAPAPVVTQSSSQGVTSPASLIALSLTQVTTSIAAEGKSATAARVATEAKAKARAKARARTQAKAAARASAAIARRRREAAARAHASSTTSSATSVPAAATATQPTYTPPASSTAGATATQPAYTPPASSTSSSSTGPSPTPRGGSGSASASSPAGPTGIGSAGSNCNPKCS